MRKITVQNMATMEAIGNHIHGACKAVICIDTGEVYTSATDAAKANGISVHAISKNCLGKTEKSGGKRYCYVKDIAEHLEELATRIVVLSEKANKYDALTAHEREIEETEKKLTELEVSYNKTSEKLQRIWDLISATKAKLDSLKASECCA